MAEVGVTLLTITPSDPLANFFALCSFDLILCWHRGLSSKVRNVSTGIHNNDSVELEVRTDTQPLWAPHAYESAAKRGATVCLE